ncbi:aspartate kinase [Clostridium sp. SYSU_GA19001]|uniref:aspartate kinase n=1 Tax=Clostridium caldaquaticum TaxID=2940653 RepID=UPI0020776A9C|nr:aspartate kinase [Clostridium caldaquaticum]MCM8710637.1 aspartate kinase [Clostridium caldaquaticum]
MKILVQKFGGTSVSTHDRRLLVIEKIKSALNEGFTPVVVVSAMGRKGDPYSTDTLLSMINEKLKDTNPLAVDLLMSCGEIISTVVMSNELNEVGIDALPLTGGQSGIITDNNYNNASILRVDTSNLMKIINSNKIPIVAGFQGQDESGFITTLGRGGSDVTASLLGVALAAEEIQIYTDVDGIMTADPRIVSEASLIKEISYNEVFQFADQGAKVIHPRAVEIAMKGNIPLVIKNTLNNCTGTIINTTGALNFDNIITGITHMSNRVQIKISLDENFDNDNYTKLLDILAENMISIDLINVFPKENIFTIDLNDINKFKNIMNKCGLKYSYTDNCSKIALIGSRIRGVPGVMARVLKTLTKANIEVLQTADSHTTIWCLVNGNNTQSAINALHKEFKLG